MKKSNISIVYVLVEERATCSGLLGVELVSVHKSLAVALAKQERLQTASRRGEIEPRCTEVSYYVKGMEVLNEERL